MLAKARGDARLIGVAMALPEADDWLLAFHTQQAVEKALRAALIANGLDAPRVHDLRELGRLIETAGIDLPVDQATLASLTPWAAAGRYPELPEDAPFDRAQAHDLVQKILDWADRIVAKEA